MSSLLIFGNGLGMSIDAGAYSLNNAMNAVWDSAALTSEQKKLLLACLPSGFSAPQGEEDLGRLQEIVAACETLLKVPPVEGRHWLNEDGQVFPQAVKRFAFEVARRIFLATYTDAGSEKFQDRCRLPDEFIEPLCQFIRSSSSHVATLNYDGLLSGELESRLLLNSPKGLLRDGFVEGVFSRRNLFRPKERGGWYLHLHGCPLFSTADNNRHRKISPRTLELNRSSLKNVGQHIVLTNADSKPNVISSSEILDVYWEFLNLALLQSDECLLFGYSGNDTHLNRLIAQNRSTKRIRVVEWLGAGNRDNRNRFWREQFGGDIELVQKEDVMTFADW